MTKTDKVLVVDDQPINVALMSALVHSIEGLEAVGLTDPEEAVAWCGAERPVLILVDFAMPQMTGADFVVAIRSLPDCDAIPVVVVTAHTDRNTLLKVLAAGASDFVRKPIDDVEFVARVRSLAKLGKASQQLLALASIDELTGLESRRRFLARLEDEVSRARRYRSELSVVMIDVDHFKRINDEQGHAVGDEVLREVGARIRSVIRDTDFVGRLGGEEFAWALPATNLDHATAAAERLRQAIESPAFLPGCIVTASFGVATFEQGATASSLLSAADKNLYLAKSDGRNRVWASAI